MNSDYLTTAEVAAMFRVTPTTVTRWCNNGKYPRKYLMRTNGDTKGSKWLIHKDALNPKAPYKPLRNNDYVQQSIQSTLELLERF